MTARLMLAAPATAMAVLLFGASLGASASLTGLGLLLILAVLAVRFGYRRYAVDRIACIATAYLTSLWILRHAVHAGRDVSWALVGTVVATLALIAVPAVTRLSAISVPVVRNLPGVAAPPRPWPYTRVMDVVALVAIGLGAVAALLGLPGWTWALLSLFVAARPATSLVWALRRVLAGRAVERVIDQAVQDYEPEFYVYTSRPDDASYQIHMWLPYLERTGRRFVIIARTNVAAEAIVANNTEAPVITRRSLSDLDRLIVPSLRAVFYVNASSGNGGMVRYQQLKHVYLGHGDSDKPPSYNPTHAMYDKVFCAGQAAIDRYGAHGVDIPHSKLEIVGRPQVEGVKAASGSHGVSTVLYAPTWRGHVSETLLYSLPQGERIVGSLVARGLTVIFRPHPFSHEFPEDAACVRRIEALLEADAATSGRRHLFGPAAQAERSIIDCINASDAMVSDVSSVVSDYLFSGKPFVLVAVPSPPDQFVQDFPVAAGAYVVDRELSNLDSMLDLLLGPDPLQAQRRQIRNYYLGDFAADGYARNFVAACLRVIDTPLGKASGVDDTVDDGRSHGIGLIDRVRAQLSRYGREIVVAGLATASAVLALLGWASPAAWLGLLSAVTLVLISRRSLRSRRELDRMLGTLVLPRAMVLAAAVVYLVSAQPARAQTFAGVLSLALLMAATTAGLPLRSVWRGSGLGVRSLPGLPEPLIPRVPPGLVYIANVALLVISWVFLVVSPSGRVLVPVGLIALVATSMLAVLSLRRAHALDEGRTELQQRIADYAPEFAVYFGSNVGADYQVGMWLPYFHRIGRPFVIITRTGRAMELIHAMDPRIPVVYRPTLRSLEDVLVPSLTTAFYVNNAVRNTHFIERRELTHVWLNHGDSEKPACFNPVHAIYDKIFAAGQAGIDRYARHGVEIPRAKFEIVGRPQVERILPARGPIGSLDDITVLYAPTWRGPYADSRVYSLPIGDRIVQGLLDRGLRVVFRAHPFNYRYPDDVADMQRIGQMLDADQKATGRAHLWGAAAETELSIEDCFNMSDVMIADVSAVVSDYLQSGKPFSIVSVGRSVESLLEEVPAARAAYVLRDDLSDVDAVLENLLHSDPLAAERAQTRVYYLGDFPSDRYADGFLDAARAVITAQT
ncbi:MAG: CDP-glycerol glycerophosphotransferase family protein [Microlunatus sp.]